MRKTKVLAIVILLILGLELEGQESEFQNFGFSVGLSFNFGTKVNRIGIQYNTFYTYDFLQVNLGIRGYYNWNSLGPKVKRPELQINGGLVLGYGEKMEEENPFIHAVSNQTLRKYSFGYSYQLYLEKLTPQQSGTIGLQFGTVELLIENDVFGLKGKDQYRTGGFGVAWRYKHTRVALQSALWTGTTHGKKVKRINDGGIYPCRFGYKDISGAHCGQYSHGIVYLQVQQFLPYHQTASISIGVDDERIRHFFQNKLIHDLVFIPESWQSAHNPHIPMLDKNGKPFLFNEGQELQEMRFYFDLGLGTPLFY